MKEMCSLCCQTGEGIGDTDFGYTLSLISGKYKLVIMYWLANHKEVMRYSEIKRCMGNISHKTLSATLKEMEADRLIVRKEYPQIPPKVEYSLSERGKSLVPVLVAMCKWGGEHRDDKYIDILLTVYYCTNRVIQQYNVRRIYCLCITTIWELSILIISRRNKL